MEMHVRRIIVAVVFTLMLLCGLSGEEKKKIGVVFTDSHGREIKPGGGEKNDIKAAGLLDSLFASVYKLEPGRKYNLCIRREDGLEFSHSLLTANKRGTIPTCALWWDMGVSYDRLGRGRIQRDFSKHKYYLIVNDYKPVPLPITGEKKPSIYTCDRLGNPKNIFIHGKDDVYVTVENFRGTCPGNDKDEDLEIFVYLLKDRWNWAVGDYRAKDRYLVRQDAILLPKGKTGFTRMVRQKDDLRKGGYDIIAACAPLDMVYGGNVLLDSSFGPGFIVRERVANPRFSGKKKEHRVRRLVCQAPTNFLIRGKNPIPARPLYKDYFSPKESIYVAMQLEKHIIGKSKARVYVLNYSGDGGLKNGAPLHDVSGGYEVVALQPGSGGLWFTNVWNGPDEPDAGEGDVKSYDVVIDFKPFGVYNKGKDILDTGPNGGFFVPKDWVCLESVSFDYDSDSVCCDALTIRRRDNRLRPEEWVMEERSSPVAYTVGLQPLVRPSFLMAEEAKKFIAKVFTRAGELSDLKTMWVYRNNQNGRSLDYNFQCVRKCPGTVRCFYQEWKWYRFPMEQEGGDEQLIATTINKVYVVLGVPQCPWSLYGDHAPWEQVLDLSTWAAHRVSTRKEAAGEIVKFLYRHIGATYTSSPQYTCSDVNSSFQLTEFLENLPAVGDVNCNDMGKALVIFANVLGCGMDLRCSNPFGELVNCIKPVGGEWCDVKEFSKHIFPTIGGHVFDAVLQWDSLGVISRSHHRPEWVIDMPLSDYKSMMLGPGGADQPASPVIYTFEISDSENRPATKQDCK